MKCKYTITDITIILEINYEDEVPVAKTQTDEEPWLTDERFSLWLQLNEYPDRPETLSEYYDIYTHEDA
jgi:hypothetical protein